MGNSNSFQEIEHKFVVPQGFDRNVFFDKIERLSPLRIAEASVEDTYYVLRRCPSHILRHRWDAELQQLTIKSTASLEVGKFARTEINLNLSNDNGSQKDAVAAFMAVLDVAWAGSIAKDIKVAYFSDCEIVHYRARSMASTRQNAVECVEFEATTPSDLAVALKTLEGYEHRLGFADDLPETRSLFELLLLQDAPEDVMMLFRK